MTWGDITTLPHQVEILGTQQGNNMAYIMLLLCILAVFHVNSLLVNAEFKYLLLGGQQKVYM